MKKTVLFLILTINLFEDILVYSTTHLAPITNMVYKNGNIITISRDGTIK